MARLLAADMPRFYFDLRDAGDFLEDDEGLELPDLVAATREALEAAAGGGLRHSRGAGSALSPSRSAVRTTGR